MAPENDPPGPAGSGKSPQVDADDWLVSLIHQPTSSSAADEDQVSSAEPEAAESAGQDVTEVAADDASDAPHAGDEAEQTPGAADITAAEVNEAAPGAPDTPPATSDPATLEPAASDPATSDEETARAVGALERLRLKVTSAARREGDGKEPGPRLTLTPAAKPTPAAPPQPAPPQPPAAATTPDAPVEPPQPPAAKAGDTPTRMPVDRLQPGSSQPRRRFDTGQLDELAESIRSHGILQPIVVRPRPGSDKVDIIAGERRWRAAQQAGLSDVPVVVHDAAEAEAAEISLVENLQRTDLTALEEAAGFQRLITEFGLSQDDMARKIGKSRSYIGHMVRLLRLPDSVQEMIDDGRLSAGHARVLVNAADPQAMAERIVAEGLSVRQAEALARGSAEGPTPGAAKIQAAKAKPPTVVEKESRIGRALGRAVAIKPRRRGGDITIRYQNEDDLNAIVEMLDRRAGSAGGGASEG